jgi:hypothetical protein
MGKISPADAMSDFGSSYLTVSQVHDWILYRDPEFCKDQTRLVHLDIRELQGVIAGEAPASLKGVGLGCVATAEAVSFAPPRSNSPVAASVTDTHTSRRTKRTWSNGIPHAQQHITNHQAEDEGQQQLH